MIEENAIVTESLGDIAQVRAIRKTTCGACNTQSTCGVNVLTEFFAKRMRKYGVLNPIGAKRGEQVIIGIPEAALTNLSFLFYIVPLLSMMLIAGAAEILLLEIFGSVREPLIILSGLLGLITGLILVRHITNHISRNKKFQAVILRRVEHRS